MNKNLDTVRKFLLSVSPPDSHNHLQGLFESMSEHAHATMVAGLHAICDNAKVLSDNDMAMITYGMVQGVGLLHAMGNSSAMDTLERYLEGLSKAQGENVKKFSDFKKV